MMRTIDFRKDLLPHSDKLFRLAYRITLDKAEAEDIAEETLLRVWQKRESLDEINNLETYLYTICRNLAIDHNARKDSANLSLDTHTADSADTAATPLERLVAADRLDWVRRILNTLPLKQRTVLQLRDIEEKSVSETAEILGISQEDVKTTHHRARRAVRTKLEELDNHGQ